MEEHSSSRIRLSDSYSKAADELSKALYVYQCSHPDCKLAGIGFDRISSGGFVCALRSHQPFFRTYYSVQGCPSATEVDGTDIASLLSHIETKHG